MMYLALAKTTKVWRLKPLIPRWRTAASSRAGAEGSLLLMKEYLQSEES